MSNQNSKSAKLKEASIKARKEIPTDPGDSEIFPIVVLISGNGSNLQAIIDACDARMPVEIKAVISTRASAFGCQRAEKAGIETIVISKKDYPERDNYDTQLQEVIEFYNPELIVLAGFMRILGDKIVNHFRGKIINIHPSLLPKYRGLDTHKKVIAASDKEHGVTIHFVTNDLDSGPIIAQEKIKVATNDTAESLEEKIHMLEHQLYPKVIADLAMKTNMPR